MYLCLIIFYTDPKGNIEWHLTHHQKQSKRTTFIRLKSNNSEIKESHCHQNEIATPKLRLDLKCLSVLFLAFLEKVVTQVKAAVPNAKLQVKPLWDPWRFFVGLNVVWLKPTPLAVSTELCRLPTSCYIGPHLGLWGKNHRTYPLGNQWNIKGRWKISSSSQMKWNGYRHKTGLPIHLCLPLASFLIGQTVGVLICARWKTRLVF